MNEVLLAEDEPVSRAFLDEALRTLGRRCEAVGDGDAALARATARRYDLLLLDLHLPGLCGDAVLAQLRASPAAASRDAAAIALTADPDPALHQALRRQGFAAVGTKPLALAALARLLDVVSEAGAPRWDDAAALRATGGDAGMLATLRRMMLEDLPRQRRSIADALARGESAAAQAELHRLRAACGFCGATALAARTEALGAALDVAPGELLVAFLREVDALLE
jgi:two-component system OmpR family response regulator